MTEKRASVGEFCGTSKSTYLKEKMAMNNKLNISYLTGSSSSSSEKY
jgi:hypothetical protein